MRTCHKWMLTAVGLVVAVGMALSWPGPRYDTKLVDDRLRSLETPYRTVKAVQYLDGGSVGMEIVDRTGKKEQFAIPAHLGETNRYVRVFVGALHDRKAGAVEIAQPEHTKRMLFCILRDAPYRTPYEDACLMELRRYPADILRVLYHKLARHYEVRETTN